MGRYLDKNDFINEAPDSIGDQVNVNHENCSAGIDTKRRLYIKRMSRSKVVAYCHHCGLSGVSEENKVRRISEYNGSNPLIPAITSVPKNQDTLRLPKDFDPNPDRWPREAIHWVRSAGLTDEEIKKHHLGYSAFLRRVIIPTIHDGVLVQYQSRRLYDDDKYPMKYLTKKVDNFSGYDRILSNTPINKNIVAIVEDKLSGFKVSRVCDAVVVLSSNLSQAGIKYIYNNYTDVLIMLDNDNTDIKNKQLQLKKRLDPLVSGKVTIVKLDRDPKELTTQEIKDVVLKNQTQEI